MNVREVLEQYPAFREDLFIRGFLVTDRTDIQTEEFPFYGAWHARRVSGLQCMWHAKTGAHFYESDKICLFLFGHAYNPFTMQADEQEILARLAKHWETDFYECLNELTGLFVLGVIADGALTFVTDASGMQSAACGMVDGYFYLSSHAQMIADICDLETDEYVKELVAYRWYGRVLGPYLPADLTPFRGVKRVVPNQAYTYHGASVTHKRFYPISALPEHQTAKQYRAAIEQGAEILRRSMRLVSQKWEKPRISLTGGIDSNTTFAAACGMYDKFETFSYLASEKERVDCEAAKHISERFSVPWTLYRVPEKNDEIPLFEEKKAVLMHTNGYVAATPDHELRKRMVLREQFVGEVEVKSWVSETVRGYWYKHCGRKSMPALSPKLYRNLYKIFICDRGLAHRTDQAFAKYLEEYEYASIPARYLPADLHFWEIVWGSWGSLNVNEMKYYADITVIYNNRKFLDLMLGVPLDARIADAHHLDMKKLLNRELWDMNVRVINAKETKARALLLNTLFTVNTLLPF